MSCGPVAEGLHHHERGEDDEDLPARPRHELQRVVEPVTPAQHDGRGLMRRGREVGEAEPAQRRDAQGEAAADQEDLEIGQLQQRQRAEHQPVGDERSERGDCSHAAEHHRELTRAGPLHGEGLLHGRQVVEARGHQHGGEIEPPERGQEAGHRDPDSHDGEGQDREGLLAPDEQHEHHGEREKARHLAKALEHPDLPARERRLLDHEVVDQHRPGLEGDGNGGGEQEQQNLRAAPAVLQHPRPVVEQREAESGLQWFGHWESC